MPIDLSLQTPSAFLEENPRALTSPIRGRRVKNRSLSPGGKSKQSRKRNVLPGPQDEAEMFQLSLSESSSEMKTGPLNVGSWEWDNEYRHRTEKREASDLNTKIIQDSKNLSVLNMLSQQLQETTVQNDIAQSEVVVCGSDEARNIINNRTSVDDCLKLKQLRREERQKRRAAEKEKMEDSSQPTMPVPRNDLFTRELHQEQEAKAKEQKRLRKAHKLKELQMKEQKREKAKKMAKSRLSAERLAKMDPINKRASSPPKTSTSKVLPTLKPVNAAPKSIPNTFTLPEQVMSSKFPVSAKDMLFTVSNSAHPATMSFLDTQPSFLGGSNTIGGVGNNDSMLFIGHGPSHSALFPQVKLQNNPQFTTPSPIKSKSILLKSSQTQPLQPTKPTLHATEYVDKQQMWALQIEAKNMKARKENEDRELSELRLIPDVKKAQESWVKLKHNESKKIGQEWPIKNDREEDICNDSTPEKNPLGSAEQHTHSGKQEEQHELEKTPYYDGSEDESAHSTPVHDSDNNGSSSSSSSSNRNQEKSHTLRSTPNDNTNTDQLSVQNYDRRRNANTSTTETNTDSNPTSSDSSPSFTLPSASSSSSSLIL